MRGRVSVLGERENMIDKREYIIKSYEQPYDAATMEPLQEIVRCRDCRYYDCIEVGCDFFGTVLESTEGENGFCA